MAEQSRCSVNMDELGRGEKGDWALGEGRCRLVEPGNHPRGAGPGMRAWYVPDGMGRHSGMPVSRQFGRSVMSDSLESQGLHHWTIMMAFVVVHQQLPELTQTHVHRVCDTIQPSPSLSSPSPPGFNLA